MINAWRERRRRERMTILAEGCRIEGLIETDGSLRIDGVVCGPVSAVGSVVVGPSGELTGSLRARDASVGGVIEGKVGVLGHLEVLCGGRVSGAIFASRIEVGEGGYLEAEMQVSGGQGLADAGERDAFMDRNSEEAASEEGGSVNPPGGVSDGETTR